MGYTMSVATKSFDVRSVPSSFTFPDLKFDNSCFSYAACFLCVMGLTPAAPAAVAWGTENAAPDTMRATTAAAIPSMFNILVSSISDHEIQVLEPSVPLLR